MKELLRTMAFAIQKKMDPVFSADIEKEKNFLAAFPEPKDDVERSYYQYKCQMRLYGKPLAFLLNMASLPLTVYYLYSYSRTGVEKAISPERRTAVFFRDGKPANILPDCVRERFCAVEDDPEEGNVLLPEDKIYIRGLLRRYPFAWHFALKNTIKIARYRCAMERYAPEAIIACNEYSFTSSVLTDFCRRNGVRHINVMHGEKLLVSSDSFFRFDECYVWEEYYIRLFLSLRAEKTQFHIALPASLCFAETAQDKTVDYTYYLGDENTQTLMRIAGILQALTSQGTVALRPHPRYSDMTEIRRLFSGVEIEDTEKISIEQSVLRTKNAVSLFSTVLKQAAMNGTGIVIDDLSNPGNYEKLTERQYIYINKPHKRLSEIVRNDR